MNHSWTLCIAAAVIAACSAAIKAQAPNELAWSLDPEALQFPDAPVRGRMILRPDFVPESFRQSNHRLEFEKGDFTRGNWKLIIELPALDFTESAENIQFKHAPTKGTSDFKTPRVTIIWRSEDGKRRGNEDFTGNFALRLETGAMTDGAIAAKIYLCLPDESRTLLAGTFAITGAAGKPLVLTKIHGRLNAPPAINEEAIYVGGAGIDSQGKTSVNGYHLRLGKDGEIPAGSRSSTYGGLGSDTHTSNGGTTYALRGRQPGWYLLVLAAASVASDPSAAAMPSRPAGFPVFPGMEKYEPKPRIYDLQWVELKDVRATVECDLTLDPGRLGSALVTVPGVRDGAFVTFLPVSPNAPEPLPAVGGASPWMRLRVKDGTVDKITIPEGAYDFECVGRKQRVKIERQKTTRVRLTESN
jgi:hypothetical protein